MSALKQVKLAVVGVGEFGTRYIRNLNNMPDVEVKWVCSRTLDRCRRVAREYAVPRHTTDVAEICRDPEVDAVCVVTPEQAHRDITVAALEAGKHAIVEKPLATSEEDGLAMAEAARRSGKLLMTAFLIRYDYRYAQIKQRLNEIGTIRNIYAYRNFDRRLFQLYSRTHSLIENSIHDIDVVLWYVGDKVKRVHGYCRNTLGLANPDVNWGILEFEKGAVAVLQSTWLYPPQEHRNLQCNAGIQVMGDKGVLELSNDQTGFRANIEGSGIFLLDQTAWAEIHGEARGAFGAMLRHFIACIRGDAAYAGTTPEEAVESMRVAVRLVEDSRRPERTI